MFRENIPNFDATLTPITKSMNNIKVLLEDITNTRKKLVDPCEETCTSCSIDELYKFLGIEVTPVTNQMESCAQSSEKSNTTDKEEVKNKDELSKNVEKEIRIVAQISEQEFKTIPKYQLGRLTLDNLNEIVGKMDEFLTKKNNILSKTNRQLTRIDREMLDSWRELEIKAKGRLPTTLFFIENDIRPLLQERLRPSFAKAIPCLRHIRRVREERCGPLTFYYS
ncbi:hypothetical protein GCK72_002379 [Caenorhabditis remanei]|nr:hypothetical protein GCK72_002379 [Caenorhabditis remanei]KAF1770560.1 hypothetical protein GCK72_002379 [Caenorhabditis remanei]